MLPHMHMKIFKIQHIIRKQVIKHNLKIVEYICRLESMRWHISNIAGWLNLKKSGHTIRMKNNIFPQNELVSSSATSATFNLYEISDELHYFINCIIHIVSLLDNESLYIQLSLPETQTCFFKQLFSSSFRLQVRKGQE